MEDKEKVVVAKKSFRFPKHNRWWIWFALANMAMCLIYMVAMFYIQQRTLNRMIQELEQLEVMIKDDITQSLVDGQANVLEHCLDFTLTSDANEATRSSLVASTDTNNSKR